VCADPLRQPKFKKYLCKNDNAIIDKKYVAYVSDFLEEAKARGFVKQIIDHSNLRWLRVAPSGRAN